MGKSKQAAESKNTTAAVVMLNISRFINNCGRYIKCRSANVLDIALRLGPPQLSVTISSRTVHNARQNSQTQNSRLGLGLHSPRPSLLVSLQPTELKWGNKFRHLNPDLNISLYSFTNIVEPSSNVGDKFLPSRVISESPPIGRHDSIKLPPCFEKSLERQNNEGDTPFNSIQLPAVQDTHEKHAARLVVIRKRKMKKHKLQKLRKKMKFDWAKLRQGREMRKEKSFQAELLAQIKEASKFDAEQYVTEKLRKAHEVPIPRTWKGKRLPEFIIKEKLGIK